MPIDLGDVRSEAKTPDGLKIDVASESFGET